MARNLKKEYLKKLATINTKNGYKIDLANYIYNPSYDHDYPHLVKVVEETETHAVVNSVSYFKHYNGSGEYIFRVYNSPKASAEGSGWYFVREEKETILEHNNRFNLNKLVALAENN